MDEALALPIVRLVLGLLFLLMIIGFPMFLVGELSGEHSLWRKILFALGTPLIWAPTLVELGSITMFGKSRTPWYHAMMRRWRPKN